MRKSKVEILIPTQYNNKKPVEARKHRLTYQEIIQQFKGCTQSRTPLIGDWIDEKTGKRYNDTNFSYWVLCKDSRDTIEFLDKLKFRLMKRYKQESIMMYSTEITEI